MKELLKSIQLPTNDTVFKNPTMSNPLYAQIIEQFQAEVDSYTAKISKKKLARKARRLRELNERNVIRGSAYNDRLANKLAQKKSRKSKKSKRGAVY